MICPHCNEEIERSYLKSRTICQACYLYINRGGVFHALPDAGTIVTDEEGNVICHLCGQAHNKLGSHIANKHRITTSEYKEMFDIPQRGVSLASHSHQEKMRAYNRQYREQVVHQNLLHGGSATRFQAGVTPNRKHTKKKKCTIVSLASADTQNN